MNSFFVNGKFWGLIMTAGSAVLLLMISDLLYKGILIAADAVDAAIRNRERRNAVLLTESGMLSGRLHGASLPLLVTLTVSGIFMYLDPGMDSVLFSEVICLWGIAGACVLNVISCRRCNAHAALFVRKFYAAFVSLQDKRKALDETCAAMPDGEIRERAAAAGGRLTGGDEWKEAVMALDNGLFCGKALPVYLALYDGSSPEPNESAVSAFAAAFEAAVSGIKNRIGILYRTGLVLFMCMAVYTGTTTVLIDTSMPDPVTAAILIIGILLSAAVVLFRNIIINGRLI